MRLSHLSICLVPVALAASPTPPCGPGPGSPDPQSEVIKATFIAPRTFPNCGFAGVSCGSGPGARGKRNYYCAPFKATCCRQRHALRRQNTAEEDQAEADKQVQDVSKNRPEGDDAGGGDTPVVDDGAGDEPIFGRPDGKFSYCPDGYDCSGDGRWCTRRPGATINTNRPGRTRPTASVLPLTASYLGHDAQVKGPYTDA